MSLPRFLQSVSVKGAADAEQSEDVFDDLKAQFEVRSQSDFKCSEKYQLLKM